MTRATLLALADRVVRMRRQDNAVDVQVECALFKPNSVYTTCRLNSAGTKIIYTDRVGNEVTCWAEDHTFSTARRKATAAALRARAMMENSDD